MAAPFSFALPAVVPQDLQLIQDIIGAVPGPAPSKPAELSTADPDHEHGTDSDTDSEKEVEADILGGVEDEDTGMVEAKA